MSKKAKKKNLIRAAIGLVLMVLAVFALSLPMAPKKAEALGPLCPCAWLPGCDLCCGCSIVTDVLFVEGALRTVYSLFKDGDIGDAFGLDLSIMFGFGEAHPIRYDNPGDDDVNDPIPYFDDSENTDGPGGANRTTALSILQGLMIHTWFKGDMTWILSVLDVAGVNLGSALGDAFQDLITNVFSQLGDITGFGGAYGFLPALQDMSEEIMRVMFKHTMYVGMFMDADIQFQTQRLYQELQADAFQRYQPDVGMCILGSSIRSLASADFNKDFTVAAMSKMSRDRELNTSNALSAAGRVMDREARLLQFSSTFCDKLDNNPAMNDDGTSEPSTGLGFVCDGAVEPENHNKDIDYMRTMLLPSTLDVDFNDPNVTLDEQAVLAMGNYLYAHDVFDPISRADLENPANIDEYMDLRATVAKRSVAEASFQALAGLKSQGRLGDPGGPTLGADGQREYLEVLLSELGLTPEEVVHFLGERPSYYAQMKMLSKLLYQRTSFYVGLNTSPENVARRAAAMEAIKAMLNRDITESYIRSESIMAVLLELKVREAQKDVANTLQSLE